MACVPVLMAILAVAAGVRWDAIGEASFWYDEVVTMRLARAPGPRATLHLLGEIDATRAPLHPLLLQAWLRVGGTSELWARSLSALFGTLTVAVLYPIGRRIGDDATGLWAAALAAFSPLMVTYSRETRMYALLTLITSLAWWALLALRDGPTLLRLARYATALVALVYTHPLGGLMAATVALASLLDRRQSGLRLRSWIAVHAVAFAAVVPWVGRYVDHDPEFLTGRLPLRFLIGMPIGFFGGDSRVLVLLGALIAIGLVPSVPGLVGRSKSASALPILLWLVLPPSILYIYSRIGHPIFGPARYNVYVAPACLLLAARGIASLRPWPSNVVGVGLVAFVALAWAREEPPERANWREAADELASMMRWKPLVVPAPTPGPNREFEVARYYVQPPGRVIPWTPDPEELRRSLGPHAHGFLLSLGFDSRRPVDFDSKFAVTSRLPHHVEVIRMPSGLHAVVIDDPGRFLGEGHWPFP